MNKIKLESNKLISLLGDYKREGHEFLFQCPYCADKSKNNFSFNIKKSFLWCFASNGEHSKRWIKEVYNRAYPVTSTLNLSEKHQGYTKGVKEKTLPGEPQGYPKVFKEKMLPELSEEQIKKFEQRTYMANKELLNNQLYLNFLYKNRIINRDTVKDCRIGLDLKRKRFVFPSVGYSTSECANVIGFEYRSLDLSKSGLYRSRNTPTGIVQINAFTAQTKYLVIMGGYIDCYTFYQHLKEMGQVQKYHIVTSTNGEGTTLAHLKKIESALPKYERVYIYLDSDNTGITAMEAIKESYPQVELIVMNCKSEDCKDFNDLYKRIKNVEYMPAGKEGICKTTVHR